MLQCHFFTSEKKAIDALNCEVKVLDNLNDDDDDVPLDYDKLRLTKKYSSVTKQYATIVWIEEVMDQTVWIIDTAADADESIPVIFHADL